MYQLQTANICCPTVSVVRVCTARCHCLRVRPRLQSWWQPGLWAHLTAEGRPIFRFTYMVLAGLTSLRAVGGIPAIPCHVGLSMRQLKTWQPLPLE